LLKVAFPLTNPPELSEPFQYGSGPRLKSSKVAISALDTPPITNTKIKLTNPFEAICYSSTSKNQNFFLKTFFPFTLNAALNKPPFTLAALNARTPKTNKKNRHSHERNSGF
jgi:hypothetical protein